MLMKDKQFQNVDLIELFALEAIKSYLQPCLFFQVKINDKDASWKTKDS